MRRDLRTVLLLLAFGGLATRASAAPITFETALPVGQGEFVGRGLFIAQEAEDDPTSADRELTVRGFMAALGYGVTPDFAVFGVLPYLDKELRLNSGGGRITRDSSGAGDLRLFGRYTLLRQDRPGATRRVGLFGGVEAPTGDDDQRDRFGRVPPPLQPGSGSWDGFAGVVASYQTLAYEVDAQIAYLANREANDFEAGDAWHADASLQYRLLPREVGPGAAGFLYGVLELNGVHRNKDRANGVRDNNSGGTQLFLSPGVQYVTQRWILEAVLQLPVHQDLNGSALEDDYIARAGLRFNF